MSLGHIVSCVLCRRSEETTTTGTLSIKDEVAAHQNCLLFSSGIYCRDSPQFHDLFGFSVEDVLKEVRRGRKLRCHKCKKKGATAGCEVKRCTRSYHYPCAVEEGAKDIEDQVKGSYGLYCFQHQQPQNTQSNGLVKGFDSNSSEPGTSNNPSGAGSTKRWLSRDGLNESPSKRKAKGRTFPISENSSDSDMELFAPLESDIDESANSVPEQQFVRKDGPSQSPSGNHLEDENIGRNTAEDESAPNSNDSESLLSPLRISMSLSQSSDHTPPVMVVKCPQVVKEEEEEKKDEGSIPDQHTAGPSVPQQSSTGSPPSADQSKPLSPPGSPPSADQSKSLSPPGSPPSADQSKALSPPGSPPSADQSKPLSPPGSPPLADQSKPLSPPCTSSSISKASPESSCVSSPPHPVEPPSDPDPSIDSQSFWKSCNAAGCTQAIFTDFINEMNDIAGRIQSDQASEDDCNHALKVMAASGKLEEIVAKQQKELQWKQQELMRAAAAMEQVISALRR